MRIATRATAQRRTPNGWPAPRAGRARLFLAEVGEQLVDLEHVHQDVARLAALERADHAVLGELVDEARRTGVADAELALEQRRSCTPFRGNGVRRLGEERVALGRVTGPGDGCLDREDLLLVVGLS